MLILLPVSFPVNTLLAYVAINTIMVRFGCGLRTPGRLCGGIAGLYIAGFLMGDVSKRQVMVGSDDFYAICMGMRNDGGYNLIPGKCFHIHQIRCV